MAFVWESLHNRHLTNQTVVNLHQKRETLMGFFSNTKKTLSLTGKALSNGMHLLAEGAAEFERISNRVRLETTIKALELKRERLGREWFSPDNYENHQKLLDSYSEYLRTNLPSQSLSIQAGLDKLSADQRSLAISNKLETIESLTTRLESSNFSLPINAIDARNALISQLRELIKFHNSDRQDPTVKQARERIAELKAEINDLEPTRRTTQVTFHASGFPKSSAVRLDGKLNEIYEAWHENGKMRWRIPFHAGQPVGTAKHWRDDGTLSLAATIENPGLSITMSSSSAEPLAYVECRDRILRFELLAQELKGIKFSHVRGKALSKPVVALKILKSFRTLKFMWKARKPGREQELLRELTLAAEGLESAMAELKSVLSIGDKVPRSIHPCWPKTMYFRL